MEQMKFCQSCGMPWDRKDLGTEKNRGKSQEYCVYCYQNGAFAECIMEEMADACVGFAKGKRLRKPAWADQGRDDAVVPHLKTLEKED